MISPRLFVRLAAVAVFGCAGLGLGLAIPASASPHEKAPKACVTAIKDLQAQKTAIAQKEAKLTEALYGVVEAYLGKEDINAAVTKAVTVWDTKETNAEQKAALRLDTQSFTAIDECEGR